VKEWNLPGAGDSKVFDIYAPLPPDGKLRITVKQIKK
jgi:hypothetical protein